ncbi:MAG TPA: hypothetical protein VD788_16615 [Candidatus Polarisedimenticolaceae bacterium]|nr:hypothetical protein [Candidatus Polarisedimenticolaceae bacterium]
MMKRPGDRTPDWLDSPRNVTRLFYALLAVCLATVAIDPWFPAEHPHYVYERWIGFHGVFGFVVFVLIVLAGKQLRRLVGRKEDYYDR